MEPTTDDQFQVPSLRQEKEREEGRGKEGRKERRQERREGRKSLCEKIFGKKTGRFPSLLGKDE